jgi:pyruvate/2-oxoglutarate dehydrogenase complex dihydrolipoamide acyltransferase (E2) component
MSDPQIRTNLPGLVVRHLVADGDRVSAGQGVVITETMKCEQTLLAPADGQIELSCSVGDVVEPGHVVARVTPVRASTPAPVNTRGPRPLSPQSVVDLVCGPHADPRLGPAARSGTFVEYDLVETPPMFANPSPGDRLVRVDSAGPGGHQRECGVMI